MSSASDIEHGRQSHSQRCFRRQHSPWHQTGIAASFMNLLRGAEGTATQRLIQTSGHDAGNVAGFVTERLTVKRVAQLLDCDAVSLNSLELRVTRRRDEIPSEMMEWSVDNIEKLISHCGPKVINSTNVEDLSLLQESICCNAVECAKLLFTYAAEQSVAVILHWGEEDILGCALKQEQKTTAVFVLERILAKCSTPSESARVIRKHFGALLKGIPRTMQKLIEGDQFCFEYGRFQVPAEIFAMNAGASIRKRQDRDITTTHSTDEIPWKANSCNEVKEFWTRNNLGFAEEMERYAGAQVTAVSKFICINSPFQEPKTLLSQLSASECSVETFRSTMVRMLVRWRWRVSAMEKQLGLVAVHLLCGILFLLFAARFDTATIREVDEAEAPAAAPVEAPALGPETEIEEGNSVLGVDVSDLTAKPLEKGALGICGLVVWIALLFVYQPFLICYAISVTFIFCRCVFRDGHTDDSAFFTSLHCVLILIMISQALRPFKLTGPFISMMHYTIRDISPFLMLGAVSIATVGIALVASFATTTIPEGSEKQDGEKGYEEDYDDFNTPLKAFETLFYAMLGTVEEDDFRTFSSNFLSIWRAILFDAFLILGAVVLLSLLIAVLGDTFDRVMLTREAEFVKCRAIAAEQSGFSSFYWFLSRMPLLRSCRARPWRWFDADLLWIKCKGFFFRGDKSQKVIRRRQSQLKKLQAFEEHVHFVRKEQSQSSSGTLIFHFLVPADSNVGKKKSSSWHGRILVLKKAMETMFERTSKSLKTHTESSNKALTNIEKQVEDTCKKFEEAEQRLREQSDRTQAQVGRIEDRLEVLLGRIDSIEQMLKGLSEKRAGSESASLST